MINFEKKPNEKIFDFKNLDKETLIYKLLPKTILDLMVKYFRLEVEGLENIPNQGPVLFCPNHSGFAGFDAIILAHILHEHTNRVPRTLTHHFWFLKKKTAIPAQKMGFIEANYMNGIIHLEKGNMIVLFPEGEYGNFKPTTKMYQLQDFKRGFIRMAIETGAPIVPVVIIGAEETHINLRRLKFKNILEGVILPLPLNLFPLPAKWRIRFLDPIELHYPKETVNDPELVHDLAQEIKEKMQEAIKIEIKKRGSPYFGFKI